MYHQIWKHLSIPVKNEAHEKIEHSDEGTLICKHDWYKNMAAQSFSFMRQLEWQREAIMFVYVKYSFMLSMLFMIVEPRA